MTHLTFEEISDLAERGASSPHLSECGACRASYTRVRDVLAATRALPRDIAPPPEVWNDLRARLLADAALRGSYRSRWWHNGWLASAAALILMIGTALFVASIARGRDSRAKATIATTSAPVPALLAVDRNYVATIGELRAALETQRSALAPGTVRTVERSLRIVDAAIAEARSALAADPGNQALVDILAAHYERQVDLLQRATELSPSL